MPPVKMPTRKLGSSSLEVPLLCLGTMTWGEQNTEAEAFEQMDYCLEHGLNFFDCAELYPVPVSNEKASCTEKYIGNWMAARGCRERVIIATKVASELGPGISRAVIVANRSEPPAPIGPEPRLDRANIHAAVDASLRRLQTTYIDLYQLHWPTRYAPLWGSRQYRPELERDNIPSVDEQVSAVGELITAGKIRNWGLSNETTYGVCQFCEAARRLGVPLPITIQNDFSLTARHFESELAEACAPSHYNISLLCYGALGGGALSDKYLDNTAPPTARHRLFKDFQARYHSARVMEASKEYRPIARKEGLTLAQLALAWAASRWYMGSVIIGATTMEQLKENITAFEVTLSKEALAAIEAVHIVRRNPAASD
eukprot:CAMPEP_0119115702 /NCGR_PEP_ID=MMETSP1180-20130426/51888_1 /TAXON_ID=3052 ORGANISM="Chlamydomonas cf sp, Strain CCMP681" /NCGR_SAMPLE_ID=MMETSP1180 /ASSEMBLY_ACC=CAM_ASM_000741 /LENGTH=370 /DNA_ID=CAMNT_0007104791 /DNA_START=109 /DNA_END=1221 /DNA_ORIENTATION=-